MLLVLPPDLAMPASTYSSKFKKMGDCATALYQKKVTGMYAKQQAVAIASSTCTPEETSASLLNALSLERQFRQSEPMIGILEVSFHGNADRFTIQKLRGGLSSKEPFLAHGRIIDNEISGV